MSRNLVKSAVAALMAITALFAATSVASAQTPPYPSTPTLSVDRQTAPVGTTLILTGKGWPSTTNVNLSYNPPIGTALTDAGGSFSFPWDTTGVAAGTYAVTATDGVNSIAVQVTLTAAGSAVPPASIAPAQTGGTGSLPRTGSDSSNVARFGAALVAGGALLVLVTRRRSHAAQA
jgi:LPXTG-motif cell wall-anchored protein